MNVTCCGVSVLQIVYIGYVCMCRNGEWMKRLRFVIGAFTAVLHLYLIHVKCNINISHIPIYQYQTTIAGTHNVSLMCEDIP
jgi:hypothetical protein